MPSYILLIIAGLLASFATQGAGGHAFRFAQCARQAALIHGVGVDDAEADMKTGYHFIFSWKASGPVKMDRDGEASLTASDFSKNWKQTGLTEPQGRVTAPSSASMAHTGAAKSKRSSPSHLRPAGFTPS